MSSWTIILGLGGEVFKAVSPNEATVEKTQAEDPTVKPRAQICGAWAGWGWQRMSRQRQKGP